jgi:DNA modification methylase
VHLYGKTPRHGRELGHLVVSSRAAGAGKAGPGRLQGAPKTNAQDRCYRPCRADAQVVESADEPSVFSWCTRCCRSERTALSTLHWKGKGSPAKVSHPPLETVEAHGDAPANRLIQGDRLAALASVAPASVDLVYIDPPFDTGAHFTARNGEAAYRDVFPRDGWLQFFYETALALQPLLSPRGSLYVHLDANAVHPAKLILDEVFGARSFQREIVWRIGWISGFKSRARNWIRNHDTLLFYTVDPARFTFHKQYLPYPEGYVRRGGKRPTGAGIPLDDVWNATAADRLDSIQIKSLSKEKLGYPTQKNEALLERVIRASSNEGDLVLDCFCGSGTTAAVAARLQRRFIAADQGALAIHVARKRLAWSAVPFALERAIADGRRAEEEGRRAGEDGGRAAEAGRRAPAVHVAVEGRRARLLLGRGALPDYWSVDWDHDGAEHRPRWQSPAGPGQPLARAAESPPYGRRGRYTIAVKFVDASGRESVRRLIVEIA